MATTKKDYTALAKQRIRKPGTRPLRFLAYGRNKVGKTTFGASAPHTLVVDPEGGAEALNPDAVDIWPINRWQDLDEVWRYLREGKHPYENVCFDGLTRMSNMALRFVMKMQEERDLDRIPGMVQQRDYGKAGELMKGMLFNLHSLPVGIVYTTQERMESSAGFGDEDEDAEAVEARFVPDLPRGVRSSVNAIVDVIGRLYTVKVEGIHPRTGKEIKGIQRRMWVAPSETYDTGARSGDIKLPDYIKGPTVPKLTDLIRKGQTNG